MADAAPRTTRCGATVWHPAGAPLTAPAAAGFAAAGLAADAAGASALDAFAFGAFSLGAAFFSGFALTLEFPFAAFFATGRSPFKCSAQHINCQESDRSPSRNAPAR